MSLNEKNNINNGSNNLEINSEKKSIKPKNNIIKNMDIIDIKNPIDTNEKGKIKINTSELFSNGNTKDSDRRIVNVSSLDIDSIKQQDIDNKNILELINKDNIEPVSTV